MVEMVYILEYFFINYFCIIIISFLELFSALLFSVYFADPGNKKKYMISLKTYKTSTHDIDDDVIK